MKAVQLSVPAAVLKFVAERGQVSISDIVAAVKKPKNQIYVATAVLVKRGSLIRNADRSITLPNQKGTAVKSLGAAAVAVETKRNDAVDARLLERQLEQAHNEIDRLASQIQILRSDYLGAQAVVRYLENKLEPTSRDHA